MTYLNITDKNNTNNYNNNNENMKNTNNIHNNNNNMHIYKLIHSFIGLLLYAFTLSFSV